MIDVPNGEFSQEMIQKQRAQRAMYLQQIKNARCSVSELKSLFNEAVGFESNTKDLYQKFRACKQEVDRRLGENPKDQQALESKAALKRVRFELMKSSVDWAMIQTTMSNLWVRLFGRKHEAPDRINARIAGCLDSLHQLVNTPNGDVKTLRQELGALQNQSSLTTVQRITLKRLTKEARAIQQGRGAQVKTELEAAKEAAEEFRWHMLHLGNHIVYGKKGLIEALANEWLQRDDEPGVDPSAGLRLELQAMLGVDAVVLQNPVFTAYIDTALDPTPEKAQNTDRRFASFESLHQILKKETDPQFIATYQKLFEAEKSHLKHHLDLLSQHYQNLVHKVQQLPESEQKQLLLEEIKPLERELEEYSVEYKSTVDAAEALVKPKPDENWLKQYWDWLWSGRDADKNDDNTPNP